MKNNNKMKSPVQRQYRKFTQKICLSIGLGTVLLLAGCTKSTGNEDLGHAEDTLEKIMELYDAGYKHLFNETFPYQEGNKVTYLADEDTLQGKRVAYLWPTSGVFSGVNALLKATANPEYADMLQKIIFPGLNNYFDDNRLPPCYQSYIVQAGKSDRFYDDNVWLAIDFLEAYNLTGKEEYLNQSVQLWNFILSGWDDQLGGGIYWCEQKKHSKNTCSNAPTAVLGFKLFEATRDSSYFKRGMKIYEWTRSNLRDSTDFLYFDNVSMSGEVSKRKYTYNTGQMLQATALLYKLTQDKWYLKEAEAVAKSAINYFTDDFKTPGGENIRLLKNNDNWFNVILFRGYEELYHLDNNPEYINIFRDNLNYLWKYGRDNNGLFNKGWSGTETEEHKWLLDQACMVEIFATISQIQ